MSTNRIALAGVLIAAALGGCGGGSSTCDVIANPNETSKIQVANKLASTIGWSVDGYALLAIEKPGECNIMGVRSGAFTVVVRNCADDMCNSVSNSRRVTGTVAQGETYSLDVSPGFF